MSDSEIARLMETIERFRDTNRRLNRRLQLLEGWWQRKVERAEYWRSLTLSMWVRDKKDVAPNMKAIEEMAYQRGYEDGFDQRFLIPKRRVNPRRMKGADHE